MKRPIQLITGGDRRKRSASEPKFDLDIQNYVSVNFNALVDVIDSLGGIELDMTQEEAFYSNGYALKPHRWLVKR